MVLLLVLIFLVLPIAELAVIVAVANSIGVLDTVGLLLIVSVAGAWLAKREGFGMVTRVRAALDRGEMPNREVADGFLILLAGALMLVPGFITDGLALVLLFPPTRAVVRRTMLRSALRRGRVTVTSSDGRRRFRHAGNGEGHPNGDSNGDDVWDVESWEMPPRGHDELGRGR